MKRYWRMDGVGWLVHGAAGGCAFCLSTSRPPHAAGVIFGAPGPSYATRNAYDVQDMSQASKRAQLTALRTNFLQKCAEPQWGALPTCTASEMTYYEKKLAENIGALNSNMSVVCSLRRTTLFFASHERPH